MSTKYENPIKITSPRSIQVQLPGDDRGFFEEIANVVAAIAADDHYRYFEYMPTYIKELHEYAIWLDEASLPTGVDGDDLVPGATTTYPVGYPDVQYAGKTFGFYRLRAIPVSHSHVEADISDLDKYTQSEVNALLADKEDSLPANSTGTAALLQKNAADDTYSWVVITGLTPPTNTGHEYSFFGTGWRISQDPVSEAIVAASLGAVPDPAQLITPVVFILTPGDTYTLNDPAVLPDGYTCVLIHGSNPNLDDINIDGFAIDNVAIPYLLQQYESIWLGVIENRWRRLDNK